jgi:hypothetical protein
MPDGQRLVRWLRTFGARVVVADVQRPELEAEASEIAARAGLSLVLSAELAAQFEASAPPCDVARARPLLDANTLYVIPAGRDVPLDRQLAELGLPSRPATLVLPGLDDTGSGPDVTIETIVGSLTPVAAATSGDPSLLHVVVTAREADAARALLAQEEGCLVSRDGATGLAALLVVLREDRQRRPRERRLAKDRPILVTLRSDTRVDPGEPPRSADRVIDRVVSLADLAETLRALLVEPPGRPGSPGTSVD